MAGRSLLAVFCLLAATVSASYVITIPRYGGSCNNFDTIGYYTDTEDQANQNSWSGSVPDGYYFYDIFQYHCTGAVSSVPLGSYCFFLNNRYSTNGCPPGFSHGSRTEDEENNWNWSFAEGWWYDLPKLTGSVWDAPTWNFCCGSGDPTVPISFDTISSQLPHKFMLFQKGGQCQVINGRNVTQGWVYFDDEDTHNKDAFSGSLPDGTYNKDTLYNYCAYSTSALPAPASAVSLGTKTDTTATLSWTAANGATVFKLRLYAGTTLVQSVDAYNQTSKKFTGLNPSIMYTLYVYSGTVHNNVIQYESVGIHLQFTTCASGGSGLSCTATCVSCVHGTCSSTLTCVCSSGWAGASCSQCAVGFYPSGSNCVACNCGQGSCSDGASGTGACTCNAGYTGASCNTCLSNYYSSGGSCFPCDPSCATCASSGSSACSSCPTGLFVSGNSCVSNCPSHHVQINGICTSCAASCGECTGTGSNQCLTCPALSFLSGTACLSGCPSGTYPDSSNICRGCVSPCQTCTSASTCASCASGYLQSPTNPGSCITPAQCTQASGYASGAACAPCDNSCATCTGSGNTACSTCPTGTYWSAGACVGTCPTGTYANTATQTCQTCTAPCLSCLSSSTSSCASCSAPKFLSSGSCVDTCPSNTYPDSTLVQCVQCASQCQSCASSANFCTSCSVGTNSIYNGACVTSCPTGTFSNPFQQCQSCYSTCASCNSTDFDACFTCLSPNVLQGSTCVATCNPDLAPLGGVCTPVFCPDTTTASGISFLSVQISFTAQGACPAGSSGQIFSTCTLSGTTGVWGPFSGSCSPCPSGTYQDQPGQLVCLPCQANSNSPGGSLSSAACVCNPGFSLVSGQCQALVCAGEPYENATYPSTIAGAPPALGTCDAGYKGSPTRACLITGSWSPTVQNPCARDYTPTCRNPASCVSNTLSDCNACYRSGGFVDPDYPTVCYCPATSTSYMPSLGGSCSPAIPLCTGAFVCDVACLTCVGASSSQCTSCSNPALLLIQSGSNSYGQCLPACTANQYRDSNGVCQHFDCSALSGCSGEGTCVWSGTQAVCQCAPGFQGADCSVPSSCPSLNNCGGIQGSCTLNRVTGNIFCTCATGWTGPTCATAANYSFSPNFDTEIGGQLLSIVSSGTFAPTDRVFCLFGTFNVTAFVSTSSVSCTVPPFYASTIQINLSMQVNGKVIALGRFEYRPSGLFPTNDAIITGLMRTSNKPFLYDYSSTPVYASGGPTVTVTLYHWNFDPYNLLAGLPKLVVDGVIASGPNTGSINLTLAVPDFDYANALYVVSLTSGKFTTRFYSLALEPNYNQLQQCLLFQDGALPIPFSTFNPCPVATKVTFTICLPEVTSPFIFLGEYCYQDLLHDDTCWYPTILNNNNDDFHLWEPYKPGSGNFFAVQYFASVQLPKIFCCFGLNDFDCPNYVSVMSFNFRKRDGAPPPLPASYGMVYGDPHFVTLDGSHFTFGGLGEFTLIQDGLSDFLAQIRTTKVTPGAATSISAFAVRYEGVSLGIYLDSLGNLARVYNGVFQSDDIAVGEQRIVTGVADAISLLRTTPTSLLVTVFNGAFFVVSSTNGAISVEVLFKSTLQGTGFSGLLGTFDGDATNDFTLSTGAVLPATSTTAELQPFGLSWITTPASSLFIYPNSQSWANFNFPAFVPDYPENMAYDPEFSLTAQQMCQSAGSPFSSDCYYDILETQSYGAGNTAVTLGGLYRGYQAESNLPPIITGVPASLSVRLSQQVSVTFTVSDPESLPVAVVVTSTPSASGFLDLNTPSYEFTVDSSMFLASSLPLLTFTAVDNMEGMASASTTVKVIYSSCSDGLPSVAAEANLELNSFCLSSPNTCSSACRAALLRIEALSCFSAVKPQISTAYSSSKSQCSESGTSSSSNAGLSPGGKAGVAIAVLVLIALAGAAGYFLYKKRAQRHLEEDGKGFTRNLAYDIRDDSLDAVIQLYAS